MNDEIQEERKYRSYIRIARPLTVDLLGVLMGVITGLSINVATGSKLNTQFWIAIILFFISAFSVIQLILIRLDIDTDLSKRTGLAEPNEKKWIKGLDLKNVKRRKGFWIWMMFCLGSLALAIFFIVQGNILIARQEKGEARENIMKVKEQMHREFQQDIEPILKEIIAKDSTIKALLEVIESAEARKRSRPSLPQTK